MAAKLSCLLEDSVNSLEKGFMWRENDQYAAPFGLTRNH